MKTMFKNTSLVISVVFLCVGSLFLFFGGTWEGAKFGLMVLGGIFLFQTCYNVIVKDRIEKQQQDESKKIIDKHFN